MKSNLIMSVMMLASTFTFVNNGNGDTNKSEAKQINNQNVVTQTAEEKTDDESLYCKVKVGDNEATCWFCDCEKLAKALKDEVKKNNSTSN